MNTLVLLPGLDGTGLLFADFVAAMGPDVEAIVVSYPPDEPLGYAELEPIAGSFLPGDRPYFLLGESFSGPIAISMAAARPPGLLGLVLCGSFARGPRPLLGALGPLLPVVPFGTLPMPLLGFFLLGRSSTPALRGSLAGALSQVSPGVLRARARAAMSVDVSASLRRLDVPLLDLRASEDRVVPASASRLVTSLVPAAEVVELPGPHLLLQASPIAAASAVRRFMEAHRAC